MLQSSKVPEILQAIRSAVRMFTNGFPNTRLPALFGVEEAKYVITHSLRASTRSWADDAAYSHWSHATTMALHTVSSTRTVRIASTTSNQ